MIQSVGFIGLGDIGEAMARNLCDRDWEVVVYDLLDDAVQRVVESGAVAAKSCREVGERCQVIGVCVVNDAATEAVVAAGDGILAGAAAGTVIALHGTVHPALTRGLADRAKQTGVRVIDAQITGGRSGTEAHQLRYMVGGEPEDVERCRPVFETSAGQITHCGALGTGSLAKLCNNLVQYNLWQGIVEAERLAKHAGLEQEKFLEVLSWVMNDNARAFLAGRGAFEANPDNEFLNDRFTQVMLLAEKDLNLALDVARENGVAMPTAALCAAQVARLFAVPDPKRR